MMGRTGAMRVYDLRGGRKWVVGPGTAVMGILNCTPDSFYDGGQYEATEQAVAAGLAMLEQGAGILDIGGESTRPGAAPVSAQEEQDRVLPVIEGLRKETQAPISIDTQKSAVARAAFAAGADVLNDVSAMQDDPGMAEFAAHTQMPVILMHMKGTPATMQADPVYDDVVAEVTGFLVHAARAAEAVGVKKERILLDPGFGFGKTFEHNAALLNRMGEMAALAYPLVVGLSRKSMIQHALGLGCEDRLEASLALASMAALRGAAVVRVHDVEETVRAVGMIDAVLSGSVPETQG